MAICLTEQTAKIRVVFLSFFFNCCGCVCWCVWVFECERGRELARGKLNFSTNNKNSGNTFPLGLFPPHPPFLLIFLAEWMRIGSTKLSITVKSFTFWQKRKTRIRMWKLKAPDRKRTKARKKEIFVQKNIEKKATKELIFIRNS